MQLSIVAGEQMDAARERVVQARDDVRFRRRDLEVANAEVAAKKMELAIAKARYGFCWGDRPDCCKNG